MATLLLRHPYPTAGLSRARRIAVRTRHRLLMVPIHLPLRTGAAPSDWAAVRGPVFWPMPLSGAPAIREDE